MDQVLAKADRTVARIAGRQHGIVTAAQLAWAGLSPTMIKHRCRRGSLHRLYRGVYAVGHTDLSQKGRWLAAVLAYGGRAVLSHDSAAALWQLSPSTSAVVHVTVPASSGRCKRPGTRLHYSSTLTAADITIRHAIPVTTRERTLADMGWGQEPTRSHLERAFLKAIRAAGLPQPEVNVQLGPYEVDFLWPDQALVVELDGFIYHSSRHAFEADRRRDRELRRRGYTVLRFTYREVTEEPTSVVASLHAHLHGPTGRSTRRD